MHHSKNHPGPGWKALILRLQERLMHVVPYQPKGTTDSERRSFKREWVKELKARGGRHVTHPKHMPASISAALEA